MKGPYVFSRLSPAKPTVVYDTYWRFAAERQAIFFRRLSGLSAPWTKDKILQAYKFTNTYRAADRVSQYLIRNVIYKGEQTPNEVCFRILLFKIFNRIQTWELLNQELGNISYAQYSFRWYDSILTKAMARGEAIAAEESTALDTLYIVDDSNNQVTLEVNAGAQGQTSDMTIKLDNNSVAKNITGDFIETSIGTNRQLAGKVLRIVATIADTSRDTNFTSLTIHLKGGEENNDFPLSKTVSSEGDSADYICRIEFFKP